MNRLRKPPPGLVLKASSSNTLTDSPQAQSRTMMFAQTSVVTTSPTLQSLHGKRTSESVSMSSPIWEEKMISREQYWAARALTAETLLTATAKYQQELRVVSAAEEKKRMQEVTALHQHHEMRHSKLERLALLLLTWLIAVVAVIIYLLIRGHHSTVPVSSRWPVPLHFTIPVLSPFTSVVEHETSTMSSRVIAIIVTVLAALGYGCFRYWLKHRR